MSSKENITHQMEYILNHVTKSCYQVINIKDAETQRKKLAQLLSLKNGNIKDYVKKNSVVSEGTKRMIKMIMTHFEGTLREIILGSSFISSTLDCSEPIMAEKAWKGIFIKRLLSSKRLEVYIKDQLI